MPAPRTFTYLGRRWPGPALVEELQRTGQLSPAASDMEPADALHQFNEANALDAGDPEFIGELSA